MEIHFVSSAGAAKPEERRAKLQKEAQASCTSRRNCNTVMTHSQSYSCKATWRHAVQNRLTETPGNLVHLFSFFVALINLTSFLLFFDKFQNQE